MLETVSDSLTTLQRALHRVAPHALLVEPFLMRRIIRLDRRLTGLGMNVPHRRMYAIRSSSLLAFVDRADLNVEATRDLPDITVLLTQPSDELMQGLGEDALLLQYWRMLFHARVHAALQRRIPLEDRERLAAERWREIGETQRDEIRDVLLYDEYLFPESSDWHVYEEFVAVYLELLHFSPNDRFAYFPAIRDFEAIDRLLAKDVNHQTIFEATRLIEDYSSDARPTSYEGDALPGPLAPNAVALRKKWRAARKRPRPLATACDPPFAGSWPRVARRPRNKGNATLERSANCTNWPRGWADFWSSLTNRSRLSANRSSLC